jgi:hypothetical protein
LSQVFGRQPVSGHAQGQSEDTTLMEAGFPLDGVPVGRRQAGGPRLNGRPRTEAAYGVLQAGGTRSTSTNTGRGTTTPRPSRVRSEATDRPLRSSEESPPHPSGPQSYQDGMTKAAGASQLAGRWRSLIAGCGAAHKRCRMRSSSRLQQVVCHPADRGWLKLKHDADATSPRFDVP